MALVSATRDDQRQKPAANQAEYDVCQSGFSSVSAAWAWLDGQSAALGTDVVLLAEAIGRVLTEAIVTGSNLPDKPRSSENGYAVRAAECDGANAYNPLTLALLEPGVDELAFSSACPIATGWTMPSGADAVLPFEAAQSGAGRSLEVLAPVAPGRGIERWRHGLRAKTTLLVPGNRLRPQDVSCLAAIGIGRVSVLRRPRVAIVVPGAKSGPDALTPLLQALLARDEARVEPIPVASADALALAAALTNPIIEDCDLVLLAGRSGAGLDDTAALAVTAAGGALALHGLALRPGSASGLGTLSTGHARGHGHPDSVPIVQLPGDPFACLVAYDMLAARLVRRLARAVTTLPYAVAECELARKVVSEIGTVEIVPVKLAGRQVQPIGVDAGLAGAVQADGFVVVAETSEGHAAGARVRVHLYDTKPPGAVQDIGS
jgi:molybdopterin molybdotransferase